MSFSAPASPLRSILKKPGTPKSDRIRNVNFRAEVSVIGGSSQSLLPPDTKNDELDFDVNPPEGNWSRTGTMRIKKPVFSSPAPTPAQAAKPEIPAEPREPSILSGYMKLLKETGMKSSWVRRYMVLTAKSIAYYQSDDVNAKPVKSFDITSDFVVREISSRSGVADCSNSIEVAYSRGKNFVIKATTKREATEWMTAIIAIVDKDSKLDDSDEFEFIDDEVDKVADTRSKFEHAPFSVSVSKVEESALDDEFEWWDEDEEPSASSSVASTPISSPAVQPAKTTTPSYTTPAANTYTTPIANTYTAPVANTYTAPVAASVASPVVAPVTTATYTNTTTTSTITSNAYNPGPANTYTATETKSYSVSTTVQTKPASPATPTKTEPVKSTSYRPVTTNTRAKRGGYTPTIRTKGKPLPEIEDEEDNSPQPPTTASPSATPDAVNKRTSIPQRGNVSNLLKMWESK